MGFTTYIEKLKDPRWQKMRLDVFNRHEFMCQYCGNTKQTLHAHHLCYNNETYNPWDVDITAILCLCSRCHKIEHLKDLTSFEMQLVSEITIQALFYDGKNEGINNMVDLIFNLILKQRQ